MRRLGASADWSREPAAKSEGARARDKESADVMCIYVVHLIYRKYMYMYTFHYISKA